MQDWLNENLTEVLVEEVWPPSSPECNPFDYFVWGVSESRVSAKSHNKFKDLIQKMKEEMGSLAKDILAKACTSSRSRIEAVFTVTAVLFYKLILNMYLCIFIFTSRKSDDFQLCYAI
jgi:hypothetical protein